MGARLKNFEIGEGSATFIYYILGVILFSVIIYLN